VDALPQCAEDGDWCAVPNAVYNCCTRAPSALARAENLPAILESICRSRSPRLIDAACALARACPATPGLAAALIPPDCDADLGAALLRLLAALPFACPEALPLLAAFAEAESVSDDEFVPLCCGAVGCEAVPLWIGRPCEFETPGPLIAIAGMPVEASENGARVAQFLTDRLPPISGKVPPEEGRLCDALAQFAVAAIAQGMALDETFWAFLAECLEKCGEWCATEAILRIAAECGRSAEFVKATIRRVLSAVRSGKDDVYQLNFLIEYQRSIEDFLDLLEQASPIPEVKRAYAACCYAEREEREGAFAELRLALGSEGSRHQ
jgi:hypothetical protein